MWPVSLIALLVALGGCGNGSSGSNPGSGVSGSTGGLASGASCPAGDRTLILDNNCNETVWPAMIGGGVPACASDADCPGSSTCVKVSGAATGNCFCTADADCNGGSNIGAPLECNTSAHVCTFARPRGGGFQMSAGTQNVKVCMPTTAWKAKPRRWGGRIWARTGCNFANNPACDTGDCNGKLQCATGVSGKPPVSIAELFMEPVPPEPGTAGDSYDLSNVEGIAIGAGGENIGIEIAPKSGTFVAPSFATACNSDANCVWPQQCDPVKHQCIDAHLCANSGCVGDCQSYLKPSAWKIDSTCSGYDSVLRVVKPTVCSASHSCPGTATCNAPQGGQGYCVCTADSQCGGALLCGSSEMFTGYQACGTIVGCNTPNQQCSYVCPTATCTDPGLSCSSKGDLFACTGTAAGSCYTNGATSSCCGCPDWTPGSQNNNAGSNGQLCQNHNLDWESGTNTGTQPEDYLRVFHDAAPTGYSFPYDDEEDLMSCAGVSSTNNVQYTITFCPQNPSLGD